MKSYITLLAVVAVAATRIAYDSGALKAKCDTTKHKAVKTAPKKEKPITQGEIDRWE